MLGGASSESSTNIGGTCAASASNTSAALGASDAPERSIGGSTEWDSETDVKTDVKRVKRDAISDMIHAHKESNHSMILHGGERKGRLKHTMVLFGLPMSDDRVLTHDALKSDEGLYDGTEWPLGA
jgi:hypothetical protein